MGNYEQITQFNTIKRRWGISPHLPEVTGTGFLGGALMVKKRQELIEIKTLGQFSIKLGSLVLSEQARRSGMLWELFKYLLTYRGSRLPADTVLETLSGQGI